jgi:uncharacterized phage protein gp47/JayE
MWTQEEFSKRIRDQLYLLDPEISAELGTPERKIIDAVSQAIAETQFQSFVEDYQFDIDTKFGNGLDDFVQLFGFSRQTSKRAIGEVTFSRNQTNGVPVFIPSGTQLSTIANAASPAVSFITSVDATLAENQLFIRVPIEATFPGEIGNVSANKITVSTGNLSTISEITNELATYGGTSAESDDELKLRFKNNLFRNIAGIEDQFLALSVANQYTNRAVVLKAANKFEEYVQITASGTAESENRNAKYIYNQNYYLSDRKDNDTKYYNPESEYEFTRVNSGNVQYPAIGVNSFEVNPAPSGTVSLSVKEDSDFGSLFGEYQYAYTYSYNPGGESYLSPLSGTAVIGQGSVVITDIENSAGTSSAGGTVQYKNVYRRDLLYDNTWYRIGSVVPQASFTVTEVKRDANNIVTIYLNNGTASTEGIATTGSVTVTGLQGIGTALNVTNREIYSLGSSSISYASSGTPISGTAANGGTVANGVAVSALTLFNDNVEVTDFIEPPTEALAEGKVLFLEHEYISKWSRNILDEVLDYSNLNKIDIYVSGQNTEFATDVVAGYGNLLVANPTSAYYHENYIRQSTGSACVEDNYLVNLTWVPVVSIPDQITVDGFSYNLDSHYWLAKDITNLRGSERCRDGIELGTAMANAVANSAYSVEYYFNKLPLLTNRIIDAHKQVNQDVLVHAANFRQFLINLEIIYDGTSNVEATNNAIFTTLSTYFNSNPFGAIIQFSDIIAITYDVPGVLNARIPTAADVAGTNYSSYYGIQEINPNGTIRQTFTDDFTLDEIDLPALYGLGPVDGIKPVQKTKSTWVS